MRLLLMVCLLAACVVLSGCSFTTTFVVVNESNDQIQIRYVLRKPPNSEAQVQLVEAPAIKLVAELEQESEWRVLPATRFTFAPETGTVMLTLMPKEALRVQRETDGKCVEDNSQRTKWFPIEEINIIGSAGAVRLTGEQTRRSFVSGPAGMCVITYR
ncbi:MAG TPA: hypothetical protein VJT15_03715 [Pyrinomonadaceae bacterium]|nr:hypothetical protein [Pyrinomonadaceae bacterium]